MKKHYISWEEYYKDVKKLSRIVSRGGEIHEIYGIKRGGLILAVCLAHLLNKPLKTAFKRKLTSKKLILVCDDLVDSGKTIQKYKLRYCKTAVLYRKDCTKHEADYCVRTINKWIVYPYESEQSTKRSVK